MRRQDDASLLVKGSLAQRLPVGLWLVCAAWTLFAARFPNFGHPRPYSYDWLGVILIWIVLALEAALLRAIVRPYSSRWAWRRVLACTAGLGLVILSLNMIIDTAPGHFHVPGQFALLALMALGILGLGRGLAWLVARIRLSNQRV